MRYDMAFGGNFYALVPAAEAGLEVDPAQARALIDRGLADHRRDRGRGPPGPPGGPAHRRLPARRLPRARPRRRRRRAATSIHPGWLDRSPCGTGTSARLAQLHARGELALGDSFVNESVIGTRFTGRIAEETSVGGRPAIVPEITGRAWITAMGQYLLDAEDPFPAGFSL